MDEMQPFSHLSKIFSGLVSVVPVLSIMDHVKCAEGTRRC